MNDMQPPRPGAVERWLELSLFASRWLMAPLYVGLALSLFLLLAAFAFKAIKLVGGIMETSSDEVIIGVLSLVDLSLVGNLVLIVVWAGYENFISRLDLGAHPERPEWIAHIGYTDLKLKLMTSIVAISAIQVLESFMHIDSTSDRHLAWSVGIHMTFIISALLLGLMDWLSSKPRA